MADFEETPSKSYINDIDYQRTQGIVSMFPATVGTKRDTRIFKRRVQDLSAEERVAIFDLVRKIGIEGASMKLGIKRYVIEDLIHGNQNRQAREDRKIRQSFVSAQQKTESQQVQNEQSEQSKLTAQSTMFVNEPKKIEAVDKQGEIKPVTKKTKDFTLEERERILQRVEEVGMSQAAREFNTTRWVIMNWRDKTKNNKIETENSEAPSELEIENTTNQILPRQEVVQDNFDFDSLELRVENIRLKERLTVLMQESERLRKAISTLATF